MDRLFSYMVPKKETSDALLHMQAPWLLLIETDYVWMKPIQAPPAHDPRSKGMIYPFNYIVPQAPTLESVMRKMYPAELGPLTDIPGSGPAPVMMRFDEWLQVTVLLMLLILIWGSSCCPGVCSA